MEYCEDSAAFIFGTALGNQVADQILKALDKKRRERPIQRLGVQSTPQAQRKGYVVSLPGHSRPVEEQQAFLAIR